MKSAYRYISILILTFVIHSCSPSYTKHWMTPDEAEKLVETRRASLMPCMDQALYIPDSLFYQYHSPRVIQVAVHFMHASDLKQNYHGRAAIDYANDMISSINSDLTANPPMTLPIGNNTPALPPHYSIALAEGDRSIFTHVDDELYFFVKQGKHVNNYSRSVIQKYAANQDSILHLFVMPHHPDSIKSTTYRADGSGITLGNAIKVAGLYENGGPASNYRGLINHEIGHAIGLAHAWGRDGCDDTPTHSNCWVRTGKPPCDGPTSNNLMDYNPFQRAITPCQLGKVHRNFSNERSRIRKLIKPTWCIVDSTKTITIRDSVVWDRQMDVEGNIVITEGAQLEIKCRLSMPKDSRISVYPDGKLIVSEGFIHNSCGYEWSGIEILTDKRSAGQAFIHTDARIENAQNY